MLYVVFVLILCAKSIFHAANDLKSTFRYSLKEMSAAM